MNKKLENVCDFISGHFFPNQTEEYGFQITEDPESLPVILDTATAPALTEMVASKTTLDEIKQAIQNDERWKASIDTNLDTLIKMSLRATQSCSFSIGDMVRVEITPAQTNGSKIRIIDSPL